MSKKQIHNFESNQINRHDRYGVKPPTLPASHASYSYAPPYGTDFRNALENRHSLDSHPFTTRHARIGVAHRLGVRIFAD